MKLRAFASGLVTLALLIAVGWIVESGLLGEVVSENWIDREVRGHGRAGQLLYVGMAGLATALALPRHVVSFLGGYAFGFGIGTLLALAGTEIGCVLVFAYSRTIGRQVVGARLRARVQRVEDFLAANPFSMTLLVRLLPVGNNFATNVAAGISRVPATPFLGGSLVGYVPQTMVFALAGSGVDLGAGARVALAVLLFLVSAGIGVWLYRHYRHGRRLGDEVEAALEEPPTGPRPSSRI